MISTNPSTVSGRIWTNERSPACLVLTTAGVAVLPLALHHLPVPFHLGGAPPQTLPGVLVPLALRERRPVELEGKDAPRAQVGVAPD